MYVCHACNRPTHAVHAGPQELACVRCGVVGFVEEIQQNPHPQLRQTLSREQLEAAVRFNNPFTLFSTFIEDSLRQLPTNVTLISGPNQPDVAILGNLSHFINFMPDAFSQILTDDNFDNIVNLILAQRSGAEGPPPASAQVRNSLPKETLTAEAAEKYGECAVCQEQFKAGEEVLHISQDKSKCPHVYHPPCILPWLERLPTDDPTYEARREVVQTNLNRTLSSRAASQGNAQRPTEQSTAGRPTQRSQNAASFTTQLPGMRPGQPNGNVARTMTVGGYNRRGYDPRGGGDEPGFQTRSSGPGQQPSENASQQASGGGIQPTTSVPPVEFQPRDPQPYTVTNPRSPRGQTAEGANAYNTSFFPSAQASQIIQDLRHGFQRLFGS